MSILRVIVAGGRGFNDYDVMERALGACFRKAEERGDEVIIISGTAQGADRMGEHFAHDFHHQCERYPADWDKYGKSAGYKRNEQMAKIATHLVAFWDGKSRGTKHMINLAIREGLEVRVFDYNGEIYAIRHAGSVHTLD